MKLLEQFQAYLKSSDRSSSAQFYGLDIQKFVLWFQEQHGCFDLAAITSLDLVEYRSYLQSHGGRRTKTHPTGQPAAPATVNRALVSLSLFCQWALEQGMLVTNPVLGIKPISQEELAPHWLTRQQQAAFFRAVQKQQNLRDLAIVGLMLHAGLRVSEVCALNRRDLVLRPRSGTVTVRDGKGHKQRIVALNVTIRRILADYLASLPNHQQILFISRQGDHFSVRGIQHLVKRYAYDSKIEHVSPHILRHSFCKNLIDTGVSLDRVALLAGHSSLEVTRRYTTPSELDLQKAVERLAWE